MATNKILNPEYLQAGKLVAAQKMLVKRASGKHAASNARIPIICREKEKAESTLNKLVDKMESSFTERTEAYSLLAEACKDLTNLVLQLKETPKYIQGDN